MKRENYDKKFTNKKGGRISTKFEKKVISHSSKSEFRKGLAEITNLKRVLYNKKNNKN